MRFRGRLSGEIDVEVSREALGFYTVELSKISSLAQSGGRRLEGLAGRTISHEHEVFGGVLGGDELEDFGSETLGL